MNIHLKKTFQHIKNNCKILFLKKRFNVFKKLTLIVIQIPYSFVRSIHSFYKNKGIFFKMYLVFFAKKKQPLLKMVAKKT